MVLNIVLLIVGFILLIKGADVFVEGAKDGMKTVVSILPTLIGLMVAVGVLRASGFLDFVSVCLKKLLAFINLPADLFPIAIVKMFSSSAATGLLLDLFRQYGPDSRIGMAASVIKSMDVIPSLEWQHRSCSAVQKRFFIQCRSILCP